MEFHDNKIVVGSVYLMSICIANDVGVVGPTCVPRIDAPRICFSCVVAQHIEAA